MRAGYYEPRSGRSGATALEYAIILPVLLLFFLGIIDTGRLLWTYATIYRAAEAAARCAAVNTAACGTASQIQSDAVTEAWGLNLPASTFTVSTPSCGIQVSAAYSFKFFTPGFSPSTLTASACVTSFH